MGVVAFGIKTKKCITKMRYIVSVFIVNCLRYSTNIFLNSTAIADILKDKDKQLSTLPTKT